MAINVEAIQVARTGISAPAIALDEEFDERFEAPPLRPLPVRARRALRWIGICLLTEGVVVLIIATVGLLAGLTAEHHLFWALGVGFCLATPVCILASVVTAEVIEDEYRDEERRPSRVPSLEQSSRATSGLQETAYSKR